MNDVAKPIADNDEQFIIRFFKVKKDTYLDLMRSIKELEMEFLKRAIREMGMDSKDRISMRWVSALDTKSFI